MCVCAVYINYNMCVILNNCVSVTVSRVCESFPGVSSLVDDHVGVSLWEDRMMAGFMPLKAELSVKDTFSIPDLSKLSTQVTNSKGYKILR